MNGASYITRVNLDADAAHRVTLLADAGHERQPDRRTSTVHLGSVGAPAAVHDRERQAPTYSATLGYPSTVVDISGALGRGGYEGIQNDSDGNVWIVEDIGGANKPGTTAKRAEQLHLPLRPEPTGDLTGRQAAGAAGAQRLESPDHVRQPGDAEQPRPGCPAHLRQFIHDPLGRPSTTPRSMATLRSTRMTLAKAAQARRSSGRRTASSAPATRFRPVLLRRDRRYRPPPASRTTIGGWARS